MLVAALSSVWPNEVDFRRASLLTFCDVGVAVCDSAIMPFASALAFHGKGALQ